MLITYGERGRSGGTRNVVAPTSLAGQFEQRVDDAREGRPMVGVVLLKILPVLLYCTLFMSWSSIR